MSQVKENKAHVSYDDDGDKKINQYRVIQFLGQGAFGKVKLVENENDKKLYAIKIQSKQMVKKMALKSGTFRTGKDNLDILQKEVAIMKKICHENLIRLYEIINDDEGDKIYFIMDYMDLGSLGGSRHLAHLGCKDPVLPPEKIWSYFRQSIAGLDYRKNDALLTLTK